VPMIRLYQKDSGRDGIRIAAGVEIRPVFRDNAASRGCPSSVGLLPAYGVRYDHTLPTSGEKTHSTSVAVSPDARRSRREARVTLRQSADTENNFFMSSSGVCERLVQAPPTTVVQPFVCGMAVRAVRTA
jgi:hypothetical protein